MKTKYIKLFEDYDEPLEITTIKGNTAEKEELISKNYPYNLTYKGMEFFDKIYMGTIIPESEYLLQIGEKIEVEEEYYDEESNEYCYETEGHEIQGQDSYLGYYPNSGY